MVSGTDIRSLAFAGSFYPQGKKELRLLLKKFYGQTKNILVSGKVKALIVPHAGYIYSGQTASWGYKQLLKNQKDKHFILIGPSHSVYFQGLNVSKSNLWETPLGLVKHKVPQNKNLQIFIDETSHANEHSLEVQLPFLQYLYRNFSISCFLTGTNIDFENIVSYFLDFFSSSIFIISSDLSHYLPKFLAEKKDKNTIEAILHQDENYLISKENVACGLTGILILLKIVQKMRWGSKLIYYDTSATASNDENAVVGYASIAFYE